MLKGHLNAHKRAPECTYDMPHSTCRIRVWYSTSRCLDRHIGIFRSTHMWHAKFVYDMPNSCMIYRIQMPRPTRRNIQIDTYMTCQIRVWDVSVGRRIHPHSEAPIDTYRYSDRRICNMPNSCRACLIWIPRLTISDIQIDLKVKSYSCLTYPKKSTSHLRMRNSKSIRHAYEERSISW